jgi:hypothetical protein
MGTNEFSIENNNLKKIFFSCYLAILTIITAAGTRSKLIFLAQVYSIINKIL